MKKVLIVDDDKDLLEMVNFALIEQGFEVCALTGGKEFFERLNQFKPDVILMDVFLGDADGRELCAQLKADPDLKQIPVALYSAGFTTNASLSHSGADTFISKPFNISQLATTLKGMLREKRNMKTEEKRFNPLLSMIPFRRWRLEM